MVNIYWKDCPDGDNERRMRYFVRYIYDADDDGFAAEEDCDDLNPDVTNDCDGDGLFASWIAMTKMRLLMVIAMEMVS